MGYLNDRFGPREMLAYWAILPVALIVMFELPEREQPHLRRDLQPAVARAAGDPGDAPAVVVEVVDDRAAEVAGADDDSGA